MNAKDIKVNFFKAIAKVAIVGNNEMVLG